MGLFARRTDVEQRAAGLDATLAALKLLRGELPRGSETAVASASKPDTARRHSAVWAAVDLIAETVAVTLPWHAYRQLDGRADRLATDPQVVADPSTVLTPHAWRRAALDSLLMRGNAFGLVTETDRSGHATRVELLAPDAVQLRPSRAEGMTGRYSFTVDGVELPRYPVGPLLHVTAYEVAGSPVGLSPLSYAATAVGLGLEAGGYGLGFFADGAHPSSILTTDQALTEAEAATLKDRFRASIAGRDIAVLAQGAQWSPVQIAPNESQFLDTMRANVADVARYFRLAPESIGGTSGSSMTYSNLEQRGAHLLTFTLAGWIRRLEHALTSLLPRGVYVRATTDQLLRLDARTRVDVLEKQLRNGVISRDEWRALDDRPPIPDGTGGEHLWPPYASTVTDEQPDPGDPTP